MIGNHSGFNQFIESWFECLNSFECTKRLLAPFDRHTFVHFKQILTLTFTHIIRHNNLVWSHLLKPMLSHFSSHSQLYLTLCCPPPTLTFSIFFHAIHGHFGNVLTLHINLLALSCRWLFWYHFLPESWLVRLVKLLSAFHVHSQTHSHTLALSHSCALAFTVHSHFINNNYQLVCVCCYITLFHFIIKACLVCSHISHWNRMKWEHKSSQQNWQHFSTITFSSSNPRIECIYNIELVLTFICVCVCWKFEK